MHLIKKILIKKFKKKCDFKKFSKIWKINMNILLKIIIYLFLNKFY